MVLPSPILCVCGTRTDALPIDSGPKNEFKDSYRAFTVPMSYILASSQYGNYRMNLLKLCVRIALLVFCFCFCAAHPEDRRLEFVQGFLREAVGSWKVPQIV